MKMEEGLSKKELHLAPNRPWFLSFQFVVVRLVRLFALHAAIRLLQSLRHDMITEFPYIPKAQQF